MFNSGRLVRLSRHRWLNGEHDESHVPRRGEDQFLLGIDAEVVPVVNGKTVYPHQIGLSQDRIEDKNHPWVLASGGDWHGDGFAFEMCTTPLPCLDMLISEMGHILRRLRINLEAKDNPEFSKVVLNAPTLYEIPMDVVASAPARVRLLGCAPSFNVYPGDSAKPDILTPTTRTTGCHLHISHPKFNNDISKRIIRWADVLVGNTWTMLSPEDSAVEAKRRQAYGRAGEHRRNIYPARPAAELPELHGAEYRVLPGRAVTHPVYLTLMLNLYREAGRFALEGAEPEDGWTEMARAAINTADAHLAEKLFGVLPFDAEAKKIIYHYKSLQMPVLTAAQWEWYGIYHVGFFRYYAWQDWIKESAPQYILQGGNQLFAA